MCPWLLVAVYDRHDLASWRISHLPVQRHEKSVAFTTQLPPEHWAEMIADAIIAAAIRNWLAHTALTINITGESYYGVKARKLASGKKAA